ncbi:MAG TPA: adenosylcobinamide-GDP ribazoletransferase [Pseudonocardiaceae bacterium]|nr:adenosylcobinamide-GDP ribazoletransferase [Pseudonocardiaceae bacterium]
MTAGLRLALSWLTILPVPTGAVDRRTAAWAIGLAPLVGALLGLFAAGLLTGLVLAHVPALVSGLLVVGALALATRGMHIDGLADTADGLGCYGPPERALAVMKDGSAGPFAVVTLIIVLGAQAASLASLAVAGRWWAVVLAAAAGRAAFVVCCRRGVPAARPDGLGALVAGSQPWPVPAGWWLLLAVAGTVVLPGRWWAGPAAVLLAGGAVIALAAHTRRRFGGVTGDVLGAASELAVTVVLVFCASA